MLSSIELGVPVPATSVACTIIGLLVGGWGSAIYYRRGRAGRLCFPLRFLVAVLFAVALGPVQLTCHLLLAALATSIKAPYPSIDEIDRKFRQFFEAAWKALRDWVEGTNR
jgi:hypothetical protein